MARRTYGQYCGIARALEIVGERWAMLIVRELLLGPRRYSDLQRGLSKIPTNILADRLRELEETGVIEKVAVSSGGSRVAYQLTPRGRELEDILLRIWRWGIHDLPEPEEGTPGPVDPVIRALRAAFRPEHAPDCSATFELRFGTFVMFATVDDGELEVGQRRPEAPDLVIDCRASLTPLLIGDVSPAEALESGVIVVSGHTVLLDRFVEMFRLPPDFVLERAGLTGEAPGR